MTEKIVFNKKIAIVDYGMGNLASVKKAFEFIGVKPKIVCKKSDILEADALVLPGVGAMYDAVGTIEKSGIDKAIFEFLDTGKPFLGICLGMQMLFEKSYESANPDELSTKGLGILKGEVLRFPNNMGLKIPHMGWNELKNVKDEIITEKSKVYFVHSYYVKPKDDIATSISTHGIDFTASIKKDNITATQFHPEKSGDLGLEILRKWIMRND